MDGGLGLFQQVGAVFMLGYNISFAVSEGLAVGAISWLSGPRRLSEGSQKNLCSIAPVVPGHQEDACALLTPLVSCCGVSILLRNITTLGTEEGSSSSYSSCIFVFATGTRRESCSFQNSLQKSHVILSSTGIDRHLYIYIYG